MGSDVLGNNTGVCVTASMYKHAYACAWAGQASALESMAV